MTSRLLLRNLHDPRPFDFSVMDLPRALKASSSGLAFVYRALREVREAAGVTEIVLVLDDDELGRQCFRDSRDPIRSPWAEQICRAGRAGVHGDTGDVPAEVAEMVMHLATLALRLDHARHDARHDSLTGLLNRRAFDELLATACAQSERHGWQFALVLVDLNQFKQVNDQLGHEQGDRVIRAVGRELRARLRAGDAAARLGGDEFALLIADADADVTERVRARLETALGDVLQGTGLIVGASLGGALCPGDAADPAELFNLADGRLYSAKRAAGNSR